MILHDNIVYLRIGDTLVTLSDSFSFVLSCYFFQAQL